MPLKYNPDTGIPSYIPDLGEELEEGLTPKPVTLDSNALKADPFKGDKPLTADQYEHLRDGVHIGTEEADKLLADALKGAKPAKLDARFATDEEVDILEKLANEQSVPQWPMLMRLINRLRRAEAK